ncbi:hypothetical protein R1flu_021471 [Riccia fluitans]|uniref:Uncharacterized protein n=1 Tax=Riccia fluitans TaxID=41844 RepID=A0ABD1ZPP5_9MARC
MEKDPSVGLLRENAQSGGFSFSSLARQYPETKCWLDRLPVLDDRVALLARLLNLHAKPKEVPESWERVAGFESRLATRPQ